MQLRIDELMNENAQLKSAQSELKSAHTAIQSELKARIEQLERILKLAMISKYAQSTERYTPHNDQQLSLFDEADLAPITDEEDTSEDDSDEEPKTPGKKRGKSGRKKLPDYLPRIRIEHTLPASELQTKEGLVFEKIGEEITEELEIIPAQVRILQHVRFKYACKGREEHGIKIAPMKERVIPHSIASSSMIAHVLVQKYCYHMPLYRQEQEWKSFDIELKRNTLCHWVLKSADLLKPLAERLRYEVLDGTYIHADETPVTVLTHGEKKNGEQKNRQNSYMWLYGNSLKNLVYYDYQETRAGSHALDFLKDFKGHVQADAYSGYDMVYATGDRTEVGCWAHARRKFHDIIKTEKKHKHAGYALIEIGKLYKLEAHIRALIDSEDLGFDRIKQLRQEQAKPILDALKLWMNDLIGKAPPKSSLGTALSYALKNWRALTEYLDHGHLNIDNNFAENAIRPFALGRKNWLFHGNHDGARASAIIYSLLENAKAHGLKPHQYMTYVLDNIKGAKTEMDVAALLPHKVAVAQPQLLMKSNKNIHNVTPA